MKETRRTKRVSGLIRQKLGRIMAVEIKDPTIGIITITKVDVSIDLRLAKVYFSIIGGKKPLNKQINTVKGLHKFLRKKLASEIKLKVIPDIQLEFDNTSKEAQRIDELLAKLDEKENET